MQWDNLNSCYTLHMTSLHLLHTPVSHVPTCVQACTVPLTMSDELTGVLQARLCTTGSAGGAGRVCEHGLLVDHHRPYQHIQSGNTN